MTSTLQPWQVLLLTMARWINRHQQAAIDDLREENRILLEQLGDRRIRRTDEQRRRPAVAGKAVGRKALLDLASVVTPETILASHRKLVAAKLRPIMEASAFFPGAWDVDLLIRTGGGRRPSDFLLWESADAELAFTPILWPEYRGSDLAGAVAEFKTRE